MLNDKKILAEARQMKALAGALLDCATRLEQMSAGEGKSRQAPARVTTLAAKVLANRNKSIMKTKTIIVVIVAALMTASCRKSVGSELTADSGCPAGYHFHGTRGDGWCCNKGH